MKKYYRIVVYGEDGRKKYRIHNLYRYHITTSTETHHFVRPDYIKDFEDMDKAILIGNIGKKRVFIKLKDIEKVEKV